ncbi:MULTISPECIES: hypothetical protein [Nocardioides]|uniref:hypothetical protein n=1 Tax=Nocardioides TaxID=1839 RepID=UPI001C674E54|nr:hypothetical protein [Nocardioides sp. CGMCC 1.13656]
MPTADGYRPTVKQVALLCLLAALVAPTAPAAAEHPDRLRVGTFNIDRDRGLDAWRRAVGGGRWWHAAPGRGVEHARRRLHRPGLVVGTRT